MSVTVVQLSMLLSDPSLQAVRVEFFYRQSSCQKHIHALDQEGPYGSLVHIT